MPYKLNDEALASRVQEHSIDDPGSLDESIGLLRALIESAVNNGQVHAIANLMSVLARLTAQSDARKWRASDVIHKTVLTELANQLVESVMIEFRGTCDDWAERMERLAMRVEGTIVECANPRKLLESK